MKHTAQERFERLMQWSVLIGFALIFSAQYLSNIPYSLYTQSDFWTNSPTLVLIRVGVSLLILSGSFLWTEYCALPAWSWMQVLGKNSLLVYWVHVMLVYGSLMYYLKRNLSIAWTVVATVAVIASMVGLSVLWMRWRERRRAAKLQATGPIARGEQAPAT